MDLIVSHILTWLWALCLNFSVAALKRCEVVGGEHMVFFWVLVRFTPGSNFPRRSVVDTEKDSSCSSGWPSLPQLICMPLTGTLGWSECCTISVGREDMGGVCDAADIKTIYCESYYAIQSGTWGNYIKQFVLAKLTNIMSYYTYFRIMSWLGILPSLAWSVFNKISCNANGNL